MEQTMMKRDRSLSHLVNDADVGLEPHAGLPQADNFDGNGNVASSRPEMSASSQGSDLSRTLSSPGQLVDLRSTVPSFLLQLSDNNLKFFSDKSPNGGASRPCSDRYRRAFHDIEVLLKHSVPLSNRLAASMYQYDVSEDTPCSGYRSIVNCYDECLIKLLDITRQVYRKRDRLFFSHGRHARNLEAYARALRSIDVMLNYSLRLMAACDEGSLFLTSQQVKESPSWVDDILKIDQEPFMGRCLGFYMTPVMRYTMAAINTAMAAYADTYEWTHMAGAHGGNSSSSKTSAVDVEVSDFGASSSASKLPQPLPSSDEVNIDSKTAFWSIVSSGKYILSPEARAKKMLSVTRRASIEFTRAFWGLNETFVARILLNMFGPIWDTPTINKVIYLEPGTLTVQLAKDSTEQQQRKSSTASENTALLQEHVPTTIDIEPPTAHGPASPIPIRLISYSARRGQIDSYDRIAVNAPLKERSKSLIFHLHGGGFVSQSSQTVEVYLNDWAKTFDVPIVSVDYALAPRFPFPRALQECFYAYCWVLENAHRRLGSTAENIVFIGDSSGGNLCTAVAMMAAARGIRRPDGLLSCYAAFMVKYVPSPSRVLNTIDPLLAMGVTVRCLAAYVGAKETSAEDIINEARDRLEHNHTDKRRQVSVVEASAVADDDARNAAAVDDTAAALSAATTDDDAAAALIARSREGSFSSKSTAEAASSDDSWDVVSRATQSSQNTVGTNNSNKSSPASTPDSVFEPNSRPEAAQPREARLAQLMRADYASLIRNSLSDARQSLVNITSQVYDVSTTMLSNGYAWLSDEMGWTDRDAGRAYTAVGGDGRGVSSPSGLRYADRRSSDDIDFKIIPALIWQNIDHAPDDPYMSPFLASDEQLMSLPDKIVLVGAQFDPVLDDSVEMAKRLRALGKNCKFQCAYNMPHGFLNFVMIDSEAYLANEFCKEHMRRLLDL